MSAKELAVVELLDSGEKLIKPGYLLQGFIRKWVVSPELWPPTTILYDDNGGEADRYCKILFFGTASDCENYIENTKRVVNNQTVVVVTKEEFDDLTQTVHKLRNEINFLKQEIYEIKNARGFNATNGKFHLIGKYQVPVPVSMVASSSIMGFNSSGFLNLVENILGEDVLRNKNWRALSVETQTKISDLLQHFILFNCTREKNEQPKPSVMSAKYKEIHESIINVMNSKKYYNKRKSLEAKATNKKFKQEIEEDTILDNSENVSDQSQHNINNQQHSQQAPQIDFNLDYNFDCNM